jgi:hypothetical protein
LNLIGFALSEPVNIAGSLQRSTATDSLGSKFRLSAIYFNLSISIASLYRTHNLRPPDSTLFARYFAVHYHLKLLFFLLSALTHFFTNTAVLGVKFYFFLHDGHAVSANTNRTQLI